MIRHTPGEVVYHRLSASARRPTLLAPLWCENRWSGMQAVGAYLQQRGGQGSALDEKWRYRPECRSEVQSLPHFGVCRLISPRFYGMIQKIVSDGSRYEANPGVGPVLR